MESLINKYRPKTFDEVVGHCQVVSSIKFLLAKKRTHAFLLSGLAGGGKTSIARLIAKHVGCSKSNITEVNAANQTGVDDVRAMVETLQYSALGESPVRVVIYDEVHRLSGNAFDSLLKPLEEPPAHVFWILCTTNPAKIPKAIVTRCTAFELKPVAVDDLYDLLVKVRDSESMRTSNEVLQLLASKSDGSPRQALSSLGKCARCKSRKEAAELLRGVEETKEAIDLCRLLIRGGTWKEAMDVCRGLSPDSAESTRQVILAYFGKVVLNSEGDKAIRALSILDAFGQSYYNGNGLHYLLLSLGRILLSD